jgi:hypothetical protein
MCGAPVVTCTPNPGRTRRSAPTVHVIANRSKSSHATLGRRYGSATAARPRANPACFDSGLVRHAKFNFKNVADRVRAL